MSKRDWFKKYRMTCKELGIVCEAPDVEELYELPKRLQEKVKKDQEEFNKNAPDKPVKLG